ncbi:MULTISPECIES: PspA/IM30 family protein [Geobacillus]|uniref:Phage shock protein A n=1 Tax=Geobacillus stearothermophilus TaxID=1422 RepID=A0ABQ7HBB9_GEOSE|nr:MULTISPECIES: PspA/IM30 family protein [Geobacillus]KAF6509487.1 Phage shock protein A [Geobacillus stearothermophilus]MBR2517906.1 PspA/IM30 family protein [Geobacillus sp.]MED3663450.1 PspA/IM30 family protein [Geobacillus stearothermophilus]MED3730163.1 PspA/IM30 family protein [Geobacillus stearothermophilus]MED3734324.1 PspA/IM30 family protein [Geobacillus stearothermophilus]
MGIFRRMKTIVLAEVNEQIDRWEDPVAMTKQYLRELEEQLERGRQALAQQWVAEQRYETLIAQAEATIEKRSRQAKLALERNEEAVAKLALRDKLLYEKKLEAYKQQYDAIKAKTAEVANRLNQLRERYDELAAKQLELATRVNAAQALKQIDSALASFSADEALRGFVRIEERVIALEAEAAAVRFGTNVVLSPVPFDEEVERELAKWKEAQANNA